MGGRTRKVLFELNLGVEETANFNIIFVFIKVIIVCETTGFAYLVTVLAGGGLVEEK